MLSAKVPMRTIDKILRQARELSPEERRELVDTLEEGMADEPASGSEAARQAALGRWLALAGTGHSDFTDVSSDKYKHLAAVYSTE